MSDSRHTVNARDLLAAARTATTPDTVNALIRESLDALRQVVPYDLATVMQVAGQDLEVRVSSGRLDNDAVRLHRLPLSEHPALEDILAGGSIRAFSEHDHASDGGDPFDGVLDLEHGHYCMVAALQNRAGEPALITLDRESCGVFPDADVALVRVFARLLGFAITFGEQSVRLERLRDQLLEQNRLLAEDGAPEAPTQMMTALASSAMRTVVRLAQQVAATETPVLILGETGTGKDVLASAIHLWGLRSGKPMVRVNCAALPTNLIESELFGHVKGAFTGATVARMGRFQAADGGTLFLDEIGELPLELQAKLLRVLQSGSFEPVGSDRTVSVDVRVIAATNVSLLQAVEQGAFREDLYYRLAVFPITLAPLRARRDDIVVIARTFLDALARRTGRGPWVLSPRNISYLTEQEWPGNARELVNALERATILSDDHSLSFAEPRTLRASGRTMPGPAVEEPVLPLRDVERAHIVRTLGITQGRVYGKDGAAALLGLNPSTLLSRMKKHGLGGARSHRGS